MDNKKYRKGLNIISHKNFETKEGLGKSGINA
jgi:hypothetical protein